MCALTAHAQTAADALPPQLLACADEVDVMRRLSCYDREMAALIGTPATQVAQAPAVPAESDTPSPEPDPVPRVPEPMPAPPDPEPEDFGLENKGPREITARVTDIRTRPYGEMIIQLDNGQVWEQKHRDQRFRLEVGDEVTITKGLISGYRLSGAGNNSIQVKRRK